MELFKDLFQFVGAVLSFCSGAHLPVAERIVYLLMLVAVLVLLCWPVLKTRAMTLERHYQDMLRARAKRTTAYYPKGLGKSGYPTTLVKKGAT